METLPQAGLVAGGGGGEGKGGWGCHRTSPRLWPGREGPGASGAAGAPSLRGGRRLLPTALCVVGRPTCPPVPTLPEDPVHSPHLTTPPSGPCSGSGSERKQPCTATQDTVCRCRAGTQPLDSYKPGVDCAPCPPGHFSPGDNQACKPWTNCTLAGKHTLQPASNSSDAICEDRDPPATQPQETQGPPARPITVQPTEAWPRTSQGPSTRPVEVPGGRAVAAILGLGLVLGLLGPLAILLALYLLRRDQRLPPNAHKPPGGGSFRTPIQEEQADAHSTLAKI
ncbi:tumor necrosis factor receptor superfamily member 4 isoform X2 [Gorilla gorilla gorilla]|uniref:tumor necrosis factor receptor superfamily member 4 isoform X2 n=1 Tax=Gorilla gorilla gorilla TaxID=9595 RepID=UPI00300BF801